MYRKLVLKALSASSLLLVANAQWAFIYLNYGRLMEVARASDAPRQEVAQEAFVASLADRPADGSGADASPTLVSLPFIGKEAPVSPAGGDPDGQLDHGTVLFWTAPGPDGERSPIIVGHSSAKNRSDFQYVFTQIPKMRRGDVVGLTGTAGTKAYGYVRGKIVSPEEINGLEGGKGRAYLVTCYPFLTSISRYVVELKEVAPAGKAGKADGE